MKQESLLAAVVFLSSSLIMLFISCGGGGSGSRVLNGDITFNIGNNGKNVQLTAGETWSRAFSVNYNVSGFGGPFASLSLNLQDNLPGIDFSPQAMMAGYSGNAEALAATPGQMWFYVGRLEDYATVCDSGEVYGPFNVTVNTSSQLTTVSPPSINATETTMDIFNIGAYSFCVKVFSPIDAAVDLNSVDFNITQCDELPAGISGAWAGTYTCLSDCGDVVGEPIELTITQVPDDPVRATYTDSEAFYEGTVCGSRFSYSGGGPGYNESGTFVMDPGGATATKTSTYRDYSGICTGTCSDTLIRSD